MPEKQILPIKDFMDEHEDIIKHQFVGKFKVTKYLKKNRKNNFRGLHGLSKCKMRWHQRSRL